MCTSAATNTTGHPLRQIKIPWQWVFVRRTAMVDFHIHGRLEKNGLGWAWQYQCQTMKRLKTAAWLGWGRIGLAWPQRGWGIREIESGGLGDKQGRPLNCGLAWLGLVSAGVGGWGGGGGLPHTPDPIAGCDVQLLWHFVCRWHCVYMGASVGGWGRGGGLPPPPPSTHLIQ